MSNSLFRITDQITFFFTFFRVNWVQSGFRVGSEEEQQLAEKFLLISDSGGDFFLHFDNDSD